MKLSPRVRKAIFGLAITGFAGAVLFLPAIYFIGLWLAPPRPVPAKIAVPKVLADAIWARIDGGRATEIRPVNPMNLAGFIGCSFAAEIGDPVDQIAQRRACLEKLPALEATGYLSRLHMRDEGLLPGRIRWVFAQTATGAWITRSWSKAEVIDTLAERSDYGFGWRGAEAASRGYFGKPLSEVTLPQAAMLASFVGAIGSRDLGIANSWYDPWCAQVWVANMRQRVLEKMRADGVISEAEMEAANRAELGLIDPPPDHKPCE